MPDSEAKCAWIRENTILISIKLNRRTDADIVAVIEKNDGSRAGRIRDLIRKGIEAEKSNSNQRM